MQEATLLIDGLTLPEAPRWHDGRLWFSDLYRHRVCSVAERGGDLRVEVEVPGTPVGLGWLPDGRLLVVIQDQHRIMRREHDGTLVEHADLSDHAVGLLNDMVVTPDGTAFVGCFGFDLYVDAPVAAPASLLRVDPDGGVDAVGEPLHFANGPTIIDGATLVFAESFANRLSAFDLLEGNDLGERRDWASFGPVPTATDLNTRYDEVVLAADGISSADAEGAVWVADFTDTHASRVMPGGEITHRVSTGKLNCFAAALGGVDGRTLFLCAAPSELDADLLRNDPRGSILTLRVEVPAAGIG